MFSNVEFWQVEFYLQILSHASVGHPPSGMNDWAPEDRTDMSGSQIRFWHTGKMWNLFSFHVAAKSPKYKLISNGFFRIKVWLFKKVADLQFGDFENKYTCC